ncbi:MAG: hypothetical protein GYA17_10260, partial [Chloroflexi bacterium]|nr:hypothetical protein [Chloroflexota bacterium]
MDILTVHSHAATAALAAGELLAQAGGFETRLVLYFASTVYAPDQIAAEMQAAFPGAQVFGCSTAGELVSGAMLKGSVVAMLFSPAAIQDARIELVE